MMLFTSIYSIEKVLCNMQMSQKSAIEGYAIEKKYCIVERELITISHPYKIFCAYVINKIPNSE